MEVVRHTPQEGRIFFTMKKNKDTFDIPNGEGLSPDSGDGHYDVLKKGHDLNRDDEIERLTIENLLLKKQLIASYKAHIEVSEGMLAVYRSTEHERITTVNKINGLKLAIEHLTKEDVRG